MPRATRKGDTVQTEIDSRYTKVWRHRAINSDDFNDRTKVNVTKSLSNEFTYCESITLGHYIVDMQAVI